MHHYRQVWSRQAELIEAEQKAQPWVQATIVGGAAESLDPSSAWAAFCAALDDDLDTPEARQVLISLAQNILEAASLGREVGRAQEELRNMGKVFGLRFGEEGAEMRVIENWNKIMSRFV
jgi:cysteinyl-tRNA synthetase